MKPKNCLLILTLICCLIFSYPIAFADNNTFVDVPSQHWALEAIKSMSNQGIISGYPDGSFSPDAPVTREQFAKMLTLTFGLDLVNPDIPTFRDVNSSKWSYQYIETARGYLTGYFPPVGKPFFDPLSNATREDIAVALVKVMGLNAVNVDGESILMSKFTDHESVSPQLINEVAVAVENNLIKSFPDDTFRGSGAINRASVATLFYRVLKSSYFSANKDIELNIDMPEKTISSTLQISGTTAKDAKLYINNKEYPVYYGQFDESFLLEEGEDIYDFTFKVVMPNGRTKIEKKQVVYQITAPQLTVDCPESSDKPTITIKGKVTDVSDNYPIVTVNDKEVYVSYNGEWKKEIDLEEGYNQVTIIATNKSGKFIRVEKSVMFTVEAPTIKLDNIPETTTSKTIAITGKVSDENNSKPILYLNDTEIYIDWWWGGNFSKSVSLTRGKNILEFKAVNSFGKTTTVTKTIVLK